MFVVLDREQHLTQCCHQVFNVLLSHNAAYINIFRTILVFSYFTT